MEPEPFFWTAETVPAHDLLFSQDEDDKNDNYYD